MQYYYGYFQVWESDLPGFLNGYKVARAWSPQLMGDGTKLDGRIFGDDVVQIMCDNTRHSSHNNELLYVVITKWRKET